MVQSSGVIERAARSVVGQRRVLRGALEGKISARMVANHPVMEWMAEYPSTVLKRYQVARDGKTPLERCKGKKGRSPGLEFGEAISWKRETGGGHVGKLASLWSEVISLGIKGAVEELIIGNKVGMPRTRTVQSRGDRARRGDRRRRSSTR